MKSTRWGATLLLVLSLFGLQHAPAMATPGKVAARAWQAAQNGPVDLIVTAHGYPDLSPARRMPTKAMRTEFVARMLMAHAEQAQRELRLALKQRGLRHTVLWITNQVAVHRATQEDLLWLSRRADVAHVDLDPPVRGVLSTPARPARAATSVEWGVQRVRAPEVWALGYTGQGIVIANLDTGAYWEHEALKPTYRGWDGASVSHDYNWFDGAPDGSDPPSPTPVDLNGHGTHTIGTSNGINGIGVAPGAKWIACRNMAGFWGIGSVARYTACFQFALAPTDVNGNNPNPALSADITNNSWACDPNYGEIGCDVPTALVTVTQALRDAGIMVVAAAGNSGSGCGSVNLAPATLDQAFSVGATTNSDTIAGFSSRGPSTLTGKLKPDIVAPGVFVRSAGSSTPGQYVFLSGTSMATPHVAGVAALVWSAAPWLRGDVDATEQLLRATARPLTTTAQTCGGTPGTAVPNNTFGYGLIDALNAVSHAHGLRSSAVDLSPVNQPLTYTLVLTNVNSFTRTNAIVTATLPSGAVLLSSTPPATQQGSAVRWNFPVVSPGAVLVLTYVIQPTQPGWTSNAPVQTSFDGLVLPIPGQSAHTFIYAHRLILLPVRKAH
ncbi:MAG: S8 family serine peptidase [Anaerolineae bacterium]|nr:S8 family serine peptidase [Thermoflexales bacterium]MDW8396547.1 S8 family serine peptidase [Anaerolineae bacterium]